MILTENEIIEALERMSEEDPNGFSSDILDLINRKKAEKEELIYKLECLLCHATGGKLSKHTYDLKTMEAAVTDACNEMYTDGYNEGQSEARKELAERLKKKAEIVSGGDYGFTYEIGEDEIDNLLAEMEEREWETD